MGLFHKIAFGGGVQETAVILLRAQITVLRERQNLAIGHDAVCTSAARGLDEERTDLKVTSRLAPAYILLLMHWRMCPSLCRPDKRLLF